MEQNNVSCVESTSPDRFGVTTGLSEFTKREMKQESEEEIIVLQESKVATNKDAQKLTGSMSKMKHDSLVARYLDLGIISIIDALKASRFGIGSRKRKVVAVVSSVVEPLRIVDDVWTMTVLLADETYGSLNCIIAHSVLVELIGLSPEEAQVIRSSNDKARRREGTARLRSVKESIERLDLVWEIEFYAAGKSTPVVRSMQTLSQLLCIID